MLLHSYTHILLYSGGYVGFPRVSIGTRKNGRKVSGQAGGGADNIVCRLKHIRIVYTVCNSFSMSEYQKWAVRKSQIRKFADLNTLLDLRTFRKCCTPWTKSFCYLQIYNFLDLRLYSKLFLRNFFKVCLATSADEYRHYMYIALKTTVNLWNISLFLCFD